MRALFQYAEAVAGSSEPVLITGETGVGKEALARAIHELSGRTASFVQVNIAGLDDTLFADTLFGHKKGAFSGAEKRRDGLVAQATSGTLFLDEIGDLETELAGQAAATDSGPGVLPPGLGCAQRSVDVRVVCATNRDLDELMAAERFRRDLYFRLSVHQMEVPPLRERKEDLPLLVDHFLQESADGPGQEDAQGPARALRPALAVRLPRQCARDPVTGLRRSGASPLGPGSVHGALSSGDTSRAHACDRGGHDRRPAPGDPGTHSHVERSREAPDPGSPGEGRRQPGSGGHLPGHLTAGPEPAPGSSQGRDRTADVTGAGGVTICTPPRSLTSCEVTDTKGLALQSGMTAALSARATGHPRGDASVLL